MPRHTAPRPRDRVHPRRLGRFVRATVALAVFAVVAGCSADATPATGAGFISGNGVVTALPAEQRKKPGPVTGETIDGDPISLADYKGKTVVVNVWGS